MLMEIAGRLQLLFSLLPADEYSDSESQSENYDIVFYAGSIGSRVHVFSFDKSINLLPIGSDYEFFLATSPGLSSYEKDSKGGAESLKPLLQQAEAVVPNPSRPNTPLRLGGRDVFDKEIVVYLESEGEQRAVHLEVEGYFRRKRDSLTVMRVAEQQRKEVVPQNLIFRFYVWDEFERW